ncbi:nucleotide exchange factor GrpE [bacterium]|nr:nucleotide exchange factor GrpE [bacterium]
MTEKPRPDHAEELEPTADGAEEIEPTEDVDATDATDDQVARLEAELTEERDRRLRLMAEMENLRKRTRREVTESRRFAQAELLRPLLEILDNFDRALAHAPGEDEEATAETFQQGVEMIAQSFRQALIDRGVRPIEAAGREFDPSLHEAVGQAPASDETPSGTVVSVVQEGYTLDDLVLRASRVIVAQ